MYSSNRAFSASVLIRGRSTKEVHHRGTTYIEGRKGSEYVLEFTNTTNKRVLVIPSVDGLSVIDGKPAGRHSSGFIVGPNGTIEIPGWIVDGETVAKFMFWPQDARGETTYVENLKSSGAKVDVGNQGLIGFMVLEEHFTPTLTFSNGYQPSGSEEYVLWNAAGFDTSSMESEPTLRGIAASNSDHTMQYKGITTNSSSTSNTLYHVDPASGYTTDEESLGTKFGEATEFNTTMGEFNRGKIVAELVFEYDTLRGLKDRGVDVSMFITKKYSRKSAFPADVGCTPPKSWKAN